MIGTSTPASATRRATSGTAAAASSLFTVTRTIWDPARARAITCSAVDAGSAVSVLVMDCTTTGCADPTATLPMCAVTVRRRGVKTTGFGAGDDGKLTQGWAFSPRSSRRKSTEDHGVLQRLGGTARATQDFA